MAQIFTSFEAIAQQIAGDTASLPGQIVVGIDGRYEAGKTRLGRNLARLLSAPHRELDDFGLIEGQEDFAHSKDCGLIKAQLADKGITIIESVCLLHIAEHCGIDLARMIYVKRVTGPNDAWKDKDVCDPPPDYDERQDRACRAIVLIRRYHAEFRPHEKADYIFQWRG